MRAVSTGSTIPIPTSRVVWSQNQQCPGLITIQCPGIIMIQCPGIIITVMRVLGIHWNRFPAPPGITPISRFQVFLLARTYPRILTQCPGIIITMRIPKIPKCVTMLIALPHPLRKRGIENIGERGTQEREKTEEKLLFMMCAGPISAQQFQAVQSFQQE